MNCRLCNNPELAVVLELGEQYLTGVFPTKIDTSLTKGPLTLMKCLGEPEMACGLVQLSQSFNPNEMYGHNYGYRSGLNCSMTAHLKAKVKKILQFMRLSTGDLVIDIGSNDGTTLSMYPNYLQLVGIDPVASKYKHFYLPHISVIEDFFSVDSILEFVGNKKAKIITSFSMLYDLENPQEFAEHISQILEPADGIWVFEQSYLPTMIRRVAFDTICHEHVEYYTLHQIKWMLDRSSMKIIDVEFNSINGGSFSVTAAHRASSHIPNKAKIDAILHEEVCYFSQEMSTFDTFSASILTAKNQLTVFLAEAKRNGKRVCALGASTKGNVLLQFYGLDSRHIECIGEINPDKFGCFTPGSSIEIFEEATVLRSKPDYLLVLPWHFKENFVNNPVYRGFKLVFPLPELEVVQL